MKIDGKTGISKKIIKGISFILIFVLLFIILQALLQPKWLNPSQPTALWDEYESLDKNTVDVFFVGTSLVYSAIDPMYLYKETGITSYDLSSGGLRFDLASAALSEALKSQSPKVIFLEMSPVRYSGSKNEAQLRTLLDQLPISVSKIAYILRCDNEDITLLNGLFPFFRYHSRWEDLNWNDFHYLFGDEETTYMRGHRISYKIEEGGEWMFNSGDDLDYEIPWRVRKYLGEIVDLCDKKGIDLILYKIPALNWQEKWSDASETLAEEFGLTYWEMFYDIDEMGIDSEFDFRDGNKHMNQYGAQKVTSYIGEYLVENYSLEDQRGTNTRWDEDLGKYKEEIGYR